VTGQLRGGEHRLELRVYYEDTDSGGVVYHANYLRFAERARTELLRLLGLDHPRLLAGHGLGFTVRRCAAEFLRPARLDDLLTVVTRTESVGGARITLRQSIEDAAGPLAVLEVTLAVVGADLRPRRLPAVLRDAFAAARRNA
jgi:acyl-CoA thioester hydrolase